MKGGARLVARALLLAGLAAALLLSSATAAPPVRVRIVEPSAGAVVEGASVPIVLAVDGADLPAAATVWPEPDAFHLALDGADVVQTSEFRFTLMGVPTGAHRLQATLVASGTVALLSEVVAFTARSSPPAAGASWYLAGTVALVAGVMFGALLLLWFFWVRPQPPAVLPDAAGPEGLAAPLASNQAGLAPPDEAVPHARN